MNTITIGDIHGINIWKDVNIDEYDKVIFVGDYVDSFDVSSGEIMYNLLEIIRLKEANPDKVILLLGNHDLQYMFSYVKYGCSGYRPEMYPGLQQVFNDNKNLFDPSYSIEKDDQTYLWTHAGIHQGWYDQYFYPKFIYLQQDKDLSLTQLIRIAFNREEYSLFQVGRLRGGYEDVGGIFWADKRLTSQKPMKNLHQIVGHTVTQRTETFNVNEYTSITFVDCLQREADFYKLEI